MLIRGSKDSMSFGEVLPEPGTEIKSSLFIHTDWQHLSTCCDIPMAHTAHGIKMLLSCSSGSFIWSYGLAF